MASELSEEEFAYLDPGDCDSVELSAGQIRALIDEIRRHRAAALTAEDVRALDFARDVFVERVGSCYRELSERAVAVLDKLLAHSRDGAGE